MEPVQTPSQRKTRGRDRPQAGTRTHDKSQVIKPTEFANAAAGFSLLQEHLEHLGVAPGQVLIGLEATSRYGENLYRFLEQHGYQMCLLHPRQTHQFARTSGITCENRSARCYDDRSRPAEW